MIIATGTGRCGTKTVAELFHMEHEWNIEDMATPWPQEFHYIADLWPNRSEVLAQRFAGMDLSAWRESNNIYIHFIRELYALDPDLRVVLLVRDLCDFIRSAYSRRWHERGVFGHRPAPGTPEWERWPFWSPVVHCAWIWAWRNQVALDALAGIPADRWILVNAHMIYEDVERIAGFLGCQPDPDVLARREYHNALAWPYQVGDARTWPRRIYNEALLVAHHAIVRLGRLGYVPNKQTGGGL